MPKAEPTSEPAVEVSTYIIDEDVPAALEEDDLIETDPMFTDKSSYSTNYFLAVVVLALFGGVFYWLGGARWIKRVLKIGSNKGQYRKVGSNGEDLEK